MGNMGKNQKTKVFLEELPFNTNLSLEPLIEFWEATAKEDSKMKSKFAAPVIDKLREIPELRGEIQDISVFQDHEDLLDVLMSVLYPAGSWDKTIAASLIPFKLEVFYSTESFKEKIFVNEQKLMEKYKSQKSSSVLGKTMKAYSFILCQVYGIKADPEYSMVVNIPDRKTKLDKYYQLNFDARFLRVKVVGEKPILSENDIKVLLEQPSNLDLWMKKLPPGNFKFSGFTTVTAIDVTNQEVLSLLKHDLLERESIISSERFLSLERKLQSYFNSSNIRLGLASLPGRKNILNYGKSIGHSFILNQSCQLSCHDLEGSIYEKVFINKKPVIIENLEELDNRTLVEEEILKQGIKNIVIVPLYHDEELIGMLELGSSKVGDISSYDKWKLRELLGLYSIAVKRNLEEMETTIQAIIKEECTAIHPSVEWRFVQAAVNLMENRRVEKTAEMESIVFENVYPLYGVTDIRNSSLHRNEAIQLDLIEHLRMVKDILGAAYKEKSLPYLDDMNYRITKYIKNLEQGLHSGDEATIIDFLNDEIERIFEHLSTELPEIKEMVDNYKSILDPNLKSFYNKRRDYELTISTINEVISNYLDEAEEEAQVMYPHYFEKYKTDGVEHGIYIGGSLVDDRKFDIMYLHNLRLWQLISVCEITRRTEELIPDLEIPLHTTHLILVQNTPLSIRFRMDEKKFDVDGTYNIRYEIMKKRIDKAMIKGSSERLTQPGKIAIVYSQANEANEYRKYIEYLQSKGYLKSGIEELELESLQGVSGLKALRVSVDVSSRSKLTKEEVKKVVEVVRENIN
ncbi:GAF domain-containing protein [Bacteroidota bacterium]